MKQDDRTAGGREADPTAGKCGDGDMTLGDGGMGGSDGVERGGTAGIGRDRLALARAR